MWAYYGRALTPRDERPAQRAARRAGLRRLYFYVLALMGLGATFVGLNLLLEYGLNAAMQADVTGDSLRRGLAAALATLAAGLPLWFFTWRPMLRQAALDGEEGDHARRSLVRKAYLYLALFAGVMGVMFSAGSLLFQLISALLGQTNPSLLLDALQLLKTLLLFALLLAYHALLLRADARLAEKSLVRRHALFPVLVLAAETGDFVERLAGALQREAPGLPVAIHPVSQGAPDESLSAARAVVLPAEVMARPSEAVRLWLQNYDGPRLVVPTPVESWHWVLGSGHTAHQLARQTAQAIRHLAEGQDIPTPRDASPWMGVVYVLAGLFLFELLVMLAAT